MFDKICYYGWEYDKKRDKAFKREGYDESYEICHTCKHFIECNMKNLDEIVI